MGSGERERGIGGVWTVGGDGSETGSVKMKKGKQKSTTGIGASLTPDSMDKEEINNHCTIKSSVNNVYCTSCVKEICYAWIRTL